MTIAVGETLPEISLKVVKPETVIETTAADFFGGKKVVLFGVPGAFTPTCSNNHLPGYLENADAIIGKGVDTIAVIAVNDPFVMRAWARFTGAEGKITFLADSDAQFAKAVGLESDMSASFLGLRNKRFSMIVKDQKVTVLNIEIQPGQAIDSGVARILEQL